MRRSIALAVAVGGLGLATGLASAAPLVSASPVAPPRAELRDFVCQRALDPPARAVSVTAVMRPVAGTRRMQLNFALLMRGAHQVAFVAVRGHDLGKWISPAADPTLGQQPGDVWVLNHPVVDLAGPAAYRFRVSFRWVGKHNKVLGKVVRVSETCFQAELRPDLIVQSITAKTIAGSTTDERYVAQIRNAGATGAGPFEVSFSEPGLMALTKNLAGLVAHTTVQRAFVAPICTSGSVTVVADPLDQVDVSTRARSALSVACPVAPGS
jgi:CARDB